MCSQWTGQSNPHVSKLNSADSVMNSRVSGPCSHAIRSLSNIGACLQRVSRASPIIEIQSLPHPPVQLEPPVPSALVSSSVLAETHTALVDYVYTIVNNVFYIKYPVLHCQPNNVFFYKIPSTSLPTEQCFLQNTQYFIANRTMFSYRITSTSLPTEQCFL